MRFEDKELDNTVRKPATAIHQSWRFPQDWLVDDARQRATLNKIAKGGT